MTLVVTALATDVIAMGADSAVAVSMGGLKGLHLWSGQRKLFTCSGGKVGGAFYGQFPLEEKLNGMPFVDWVPRYVDEQLKAMDLAKALNALAMRLDQVIDKNWTGAVGMHFAFWAQWDDFSEKVLPSLLRVRRNEIGGPYTVTRFPPDDIIQKFVGTAKDDYASYIATDGIARVGSVLRELNTTFEKIVGGTIKLGNAGAIGEYVRRLIETVAWIYQFTDLGAVVSTPVNLLLLPRDRVSSLTIRY